MTDKKEEPVEIKFPETPELLVIRQAAPFSVVDDAPWLCGFHRDDIKGFRCCRPAVDIMIGANEVSGMYFIPICTDCIPITMRETEESVTFAHKFGAVTSDVEPTDA